MDITVENGTADDEIEILEVEVAAGATVAEGDRLVEIATDKANVDVLAPTAGTVTAVHVAEGDTVAGDTVLLVLEAG